MRQSKWLLVLGLGLLCLVGGGVVLLTVGLSTGQSWFGKYFAEEQLKGFVRSTSGETVYGVNCQAVDTDRDGFVTCDYTTVSKPNTPRTAECVAWSWQGFFQQRCKAQND